MTDWRLFSVHDQLIERQIGDRTAQPSLHFFQVFPAERLVRLQTKEGELPDVDVNASGGQLPEFNVEGPTVNVGSENKTIQVPTVDVDVPDDEKK